MFALIFARGCTKVQRIHPLYWQVLIWLHQEVDSNSTPCMKAQAGTCPACPKGTALVTALGLDFALLLTEQPLPLAIPSHSPLHG